MDKKLHFPNRQMKMKMENYGENVERQIYDILKTVDTISTCRTKNFFHLPRNA